VKQEQARKQNMERRSSFATRKDVVNKTLLRAIKRYITEKLQAFFAELQKGVGNEPKPALSGSGNGVPALGSRSEEHKEIKKLTSEQQVEGNDDFPHMLDQFVNWYFPAISMVVKEEGDTENDAETVL